MWLGFLVQKFKKNLTTKVRENLAPGVRENLAPKISGKIDPPRFGKIPEAAQQRADAPKPAGPRRCKAAQLRGHANPK